MRRSEVRYLPTGPDCTARRLIIARLGAPDASRQQLNLAFQVNRQRIAQAVADASVPEAGKRAILQNV